MNSLVWQLLSESINDRWWLAAQVLGESQLPSVLAYLHCTRALVPVEYRLHHDDMCARYPQYPPLSQLKPEEYAAWVAEQNREALACKAQVLARQKEEEAARRRERGW